MPEWTADKISNMTAEEDGVGTPSAVSAGYISQVPDPNSAVFHLGIMRNVEREISKRKRKSTQNWVLVQYFLLGHTSKGGSTSCCIHCRWMGVDPEGYTFREEI